MGKHNHTVTLPREELEQLEKESLEFYKMKRGIIVDFKVPEESGMYHRTNTLKYDLIINEKAFPQYWLGHLDNINTIIIEAKDGSKYIAQVTQKIVPE